MAPLPQAGAVATHAVDPGRAFGPLIAADRRKDAPCGAAYGLFRGRGGGTCAALVRRGRAACHSGISGTAAVICLEGRRLGGVWSRYPVAPNRSEEHTSELQSLMRISYA